MTQKKNRFIGRPLVTSGLTIVISCIFIYIALQSISIEETLTRISQANPFWLLIGVGSTSFAILCRAVRWQHLLQIDKSEPYLFFYVSIGTLLNQLPMRVGDFTRASLIQSRGIPLVTALSTLLIENLLDIVVVVTVLLLSFGFLPSTPSEILTMSYLFGLFSFGGVGLIVFLIRQPSLGHRITSNLSRFRLFRLIGIEDRYTELLRGGESFKSTHSLIKVVLWTLLLWITNVSGFYAIATAFEVSIDNVLLWSIVSVMLISLSIAIPISYAGIGPYQAAVIIAGNMIGIEMIDSISIGIVVHALSILTFLGWGLISSVILKWLTDQPKSKSVTTTF